MPKKGILGERQVRWASGTLEALRTCPEDVRAVVGRTLYRAQVGPMSGDLGVAMQGALRGVFEVRTSHDGNAYRAYYTLKCPGALYVLHVHKKKSKRGARLPTADRDLIVRRLSAALAHCKEGGV